MHIYVAGGSGRNGSLVIAEALQRGHTVTALVRNPSSMPSSHANLTVLQGSPLQQADVERALATPLRAAAVVSTLSLARTGTSPFSPLRGDTTPDFMSRATSVLLAALDAVFPSTTSSSSSSSSSSSPQTSSSPKLIINSTLGAGDSWESMPWAFRLLFSQTPMRFGVADHTRVDGLVRASGRRFVMARAARLTEQKREQHPVADVRVLPDNGKGLGLADALTRQSLARWLVRAAEEETWVGKAPVLVN